MAFVDSQSSAGPDVGARSRPSPGQGSGSWGDTGRNDGADRTGFLDVDRVMDLFAGWLHRKWSKKRVRTMCTPRATDRVVLASGGAGLGRLAGEWRKFEGWNPVRVPPRAQRYRRSAALWGAKCGQKYATVRSDATGQAGDTPGARPRSPMPWDSQVSESSTEPTNVESADEPPCSPCIASRLCRDRADRGRRRPATHRLVDKIAPLLAGVCAARAQSRRSKSDSDSTCTVVASRWQRLSSSSLRSVHRPPEDESAKQRVDAPG